MKKTITHFGTKKAILAKTPSWANNIIAVTVIITGVLQYIIQEDKSIEVMLGEKLGLYLNAINMLAVALSRLFGVTDRNLTDKIMTHESNTECTDLP